MSVFRKGEPLGGGASPESGRRWKIRVTTADGRMLYWHKAGQLHVVDEDVARVFVANFKPDLFRILADGSFTPSRTEEAFSVAKVEMEPA